MTTIKAKSGFDEPITEEVLARALERGRMRHDANAEDIDLLTTLRTHVAARYGNQRRAAAAWGVTQQFVSLVLTGKCPPNDVILADAGLVREVRYRRVQSVPPYTCRYCGAPSWLEPVDQCAPPDYCHPADHGVPE